jgi:hypothetical protein
MTQYEQTLLESSSKVCGTTALFVFLCSIRIARACELLPWMTLFVDVLDFRGEAP